MIYSLKVELPLLRSGQDLRVAKSKESLILRIEILGTKVNHYKPQNRVKKRLPQLLDQDRGKIII